ncbi:hypothetical protein D3C78_1518930 [compost metagenome]
MPRLESNNTNAESEKIYPTKLPSTTPTTITGKRLNVICVIRLKVLYPIPLRIPNSRLRFIIKVLITKYKIKLTTIIVTAVMTAVIEDTAAVNVLSVLSNMSKIFVTFHCPGRRSSSF